jgi:hypothetical protein
VSAKHSFHLQSRDKTRDLPRRIIIGQMFGELCGLMQGRNELFWVEGTFEPPRMQFDFNGLWFDAPFTVLRY